MARNRSWDYYKANQRMAGLKIIEVKIQGTTQRNTVYRVSFDCCGSRRDLTHGRINARIASGHRECGKCVRTRWKYYEPGQIIAGAEILARISVIGKSQKGTVYLTKAQCCGVESELSHCRIRRRELAGSILCPDCARKNGMEAYKAANADRAAKAAGARRLRAEKKRQQEKEGFSTSGPPYGIEHRPEWPRPNWIKPGAHTIWEDRMCQA